MTNTMCSLNLNNNISIRPLRADEIDVRIGMCRNNAASFLLYKDARCDMRILDELFSPFGWQREHKELKGVIYCGVSVKHGAEWITKWDAGSESNVEKEKGEASDSFKRACFNWGIGVELYTAPFIWVKFNEGETDKNIKLYVSDIQVSDDKRITRLILKDKNGNVRYQFNQRQTVNVQPQTSSQQREPKTTLMPSDLLDLINAASSVQALSALWNANLATIQREPSLKDAFTARRTIIQQDQQQ
jgi:hypothetical protein